jgi:hypothetical protein
MGRRSCKNIKNKTILNVNQSLSVVKEVLSGKFYL